VSKRDQFMGLSTLSESVGARRREGGATGPAPVALPADQVGRERARNAWAIDVDRIVPDPTQPRREFDEEALGRMAQSLKARGQLQPIQVRWDAAVERFVILMGERRWRAAQLAGMPKLHCVVRDEPLSDEQRLALQVIENCLREDLSPMEQARAFKTLMERQGWTQEQLAAELALSRTAVVRALSLLKLPGAVQDQVEQGGVAPSVAHELAKLDDPAEQIRLADATVKQGLTHKDVAVQVRRPSKAKKVKAARVPTTVVLRVMGFRIEVSRKAGVPREDLEAVLLAALAQLKEAADQGRADQAA